jgi:hypothetical protein
LINLKPDTHKYTETSFRCCSHLTLQTFQDVHRETNFVKRFSKTVIMKFPSSMFLFFIYRLIDSDHIYLVDVLIVVLLRLTRRLLSVVPNE